MAAFEIVVTSEKPPFQSLKGFQRFCGEEVKAQRKHKIMFQSLKGFQRFCGSAGISWAFSTTEAFQSLKGFQRFCGVMDRSPPHITPCFNP